MILEIIILATPFFQLLAVTINNKKFFRSEKMQKFLFLVFAIIIISITNEVLKSLSRQKNKGIILKIVILITGALPLCLAFWLSNVVIGLEIEQDSAILVIVLLLSLYTVFFGMSVWSVLKKEK